MTTTAVAHVPVEAGQYRREDKRLLNVLKVNTDGQTCLVEDVYNGAVFTVRKARLLTSPLITPEPDAEPDKEQAHG